MNKAERRLVEVIEIWPHLTTWEKYQLLFLALWWAKVVNPIRKFLTWVGLGELVSRQWGVRLPVILLVILIVGLFLWIVEINSAYLSSLVYLALLAALIAQAVSGGE